MKQQYCKSALLLILLATSAIGLHAQSLNKEFHKEYQTTLSTELYIENQFGDVVVQAWDQSKIVIDVTVKVSADKQELAQKLLDRIAVNFKEEGNKLSAITSMKSEASVKGKNTEFQINYMVKCPESVKLSIENQFGDVSLGSHTGSVDLEVQFGSINAVSLTGAKTTIELQFGKATINEMKNGSVEVQHCDLVKIASSQVLDIEAQFSELKIGKIDQLSAELEHCSSIIEELTDKLTLEASMGSLEIDHVASGFTLIDIEQSMGELKMTMDPKAGYRLSVESAMGNVSVPDGFKSSKRDSDHEYDNMTTKVSGTAGDGHGTVKINVSMGSVKIR
jgi:hypothetical protein